MPVLRIFVSLVTPSSDHQVDAQRQHLMTGDWLNTGHQAFCVYCAPFMSEPKQGLSYSRCPKNNLHIYSGKFVLST